MKIALLAQAHPEASEQEVVAHVRASRRQAWPNSLLIGFADDLLGREGRLSATLPAIYRAQLAAFPLVDEVMRRYGREAELELAAAA